MFKCVWRCYRFMKYMNSAEERSGSKMLQKVSLLGSQVPGLPLYIFTYMRKYYSAMKNNEILQFEVTWMDLEAIMLTEVRQRKVNTVHYHFYMASKIERNG